MATIEEQIDAKIGEIRTEAVDLSFGEIVNLHSDKELIIHPEYQRLFRWSQEQKSRLIESVLLELPIPQIFVIENADGVLELIDGLQRVSSVIQFINPTVLGLEPLQLQGCDLIKDLNGNNFEKLSLRLKLRIKRSSVRTIVIKRQSRSFLRYEMFKRLNTGGSILSAQEIRNCSSRMIGEDGIKFYSFLQRCAAQLDFKACTESLADADRDQKGDEELVLRFIAVKNAQDLFRGSVRDWLDDYMESILLDEIEFDYDAEWDTFQGLFRYLNMAMGNRAFVKYRGSSPVGGLAPAYFEAVTMGVLRVLGSISGVDMAEVRDAVISTVQTETFRRFTGPGANSKEKLEGRITAVQQALSELVK